MASSFDLPQMTLPQLHALDRALRGAIAAVECRGAGAFDVSIYADADGVSVTFTTFPASNPERTDHD